MSFDKDCPKVGTTAQHGLAVLEARAAGFAQLSHAVSKALKIPLDSVRRTTRPMDKESASRVISFLKDMNGEGEK